MENGQSAQPAEDGDDSSVMELGEDIDRQIRRLRNIAATPEQVTPAFLLGEIYGTLLPLLRDLLPYVERIEGHAAWASETLEHLGEIVAGGEESSQLYPSDAEKIKAFLSSIEQEAREDVERYAPTAPGADADAQGRAQARLLAVQEVLSLVDEITLEPEPDEDDDGDDDDEEGQGDGPAAAGEAPRAEE